MPPSWPRLRPTSRCSMTTTTCRFPFLASLTQPCSARRGWLLSTPTTESSYEPLPPQPVHPAGARQAPGRAGRQERRVQVVHCRRCLGVLAVAGRSRSEEHTSELQSLMRISYAVFCLKKKNTNTHQVAIPMTTITHQQTHYMTQ